LQKGKARRAPFFPYNRKGERIRHGIFAFCAEMRETLEEGGRMNRLFIPKRGKKKVSR